MEAQGFYQSVAETEGFYRQIAQEVNGACEQGWLNCQPRRRASFIPRISGDLIGPWLMSSLHLGRQLTHSSLVLRLDSGLEDLELRERYYRQITREPADFFPSSFKPPQPSQRSVNSGALSPLSTAISHLFRIKPTRLALEFSAIRLPSCSFWR